MSSISGDGPSIPAVSDASATPRTAVSYHPDPSVRWSPHAVIAGFGSLLTFLLSTSSARSNAEPILIVLVIWFLLHVAAFLLVGIIRLDLSPAGIRSRRIGASIAAAWGDVEAAPFSGSGQGLVLKAPMTTGMSKVEAELSSLQRDGVYVLGETECKWVAQRRWLSLKMYAQSIRKGDLAAQIDGFAPQLRAVEAREKWLHPPAERSPPWTAATLKAAASIVGTIGVTIALIRWNENVLYFILFAFMCLTFFYYAAHQIHLAVVSLKRHNYTGAAISLALGIPSYMFMYFVIGGIIDGVRHPTGGQQPSARHAPAPVGQTAPAPPGDRRPAARP